MSTIPKQPNEAQLAAQMAAALTVPPPPPPTATFVAVDPGPLVIEYTPLDLARVAYADAETELRVAKEWGSPAETLRQLRCELIEARDKLVEAGGVGFIKDYRPLRLEMLQTTYSAAAYACWHAKTAEERATQYEQVMLAYDASLLEGNHLGARPFLL